MHIKKVAEETAKFDQEWSRGWAARCHGNGLGPNETDAYRAGWQAAKDHGL